MSPEEKELFNIAYGRLPKPTEGGIWDVSWVEVNLGPRCYGKMKMGHYNLKKVDGEPESLIIPMTHCKGEEMEFPHVKPKYMWNKKCGWVKSRVKRNV